MPSIFSLQNTSFRFVIETLSFNFLVPPSSLKCFCIIIMVLQLPTDKISLDSNISSDNNINVVLVAAGSFNPPTFMHLRMFEMAKDDLESEGYSLIAGYMSPVSDAYKKPWLISDDHRLRMCNLASESSDFIMVDPWEANQSTYQLTLTILERIVGFFVNDWQIPRESLRVMLVCGSDLIQSFSIPGFLVREQVRTICRDYGDYGVVCILGEGKYVEKTISDDEILNGNKGNIRVVYELVPNLISSTRMRECISRGLSIKNLTADGVIGYIGEKRLYLTSNDK